MPSPTPAFRVEEGSYYPFEGGGTHASADLAEPQDQDPVFNLPFMRAMPHKPPEAAPRFLNFGRRALANREMYPAGRVAASCREGLSLSCRSRRGWQGRVALRTASARTSVSAPETALGSHICVA